MTNYVLRIFSVLSNALFPLSASQKAVRELTPEKAAHALPPASAPPLEGCHSLFAYKDEAVKALVWNIKYKKDFQAVKIASFCLHEKIKNLYGNRLKNELFPIVVIPMPITSRRRKERGYNQCELLTEEMIRLHRKENEKARKTYFENNLLIRTHHTSRQTLKNRNERLENAKGLFSINPLLSLDKKIQLVVIDDVITTGSTMKDAMDALKKAGYERIHGLSIAH